MRTASPSHVSRVFLTTAMLLSMIAASCSLWAGPLHAEPTHSDPFVAVGYSSKNTPGGGTDNFVTYALGWRFFFGAGERIDNWLSDTPWSAAVVVEPYLGLITGDADSYEASVVPMLRFERNRHNDIWPFFEGGIGFMYSELRNYGLGSRWLFNDTIGGGLSFAADSGRIWDFGYRYRHISHADLFASENSGLNTHFLTVTVRGLGD